MWSKLNSLPPQPQWKGKVFKAKDSGLSGPRAHTHLTCSSSIHLLTLCDHTTPVHQHATPVYKNTTCAHQHTTHTHAPTSTAHASMSTAHTSMGTHVSTSTDRMSSVLCHHGHSALPCYMCRTYHTLINCLDSTEPGSGPLLYSKYPEHYLLIQSAQQRFRTANECSTELSNCDMVGVLQVIFKCDK